MIKLFFILVLILFVGSNIVDWYDEGKSMFSYESPKTIENKHKIAYSKMTYNEKMDWYRNNLTLENMKKNVEKLNYSGKIF